MNVSRCLFVLASLLAVHTLAAATVNCNAPPQPGVPANVAAAGFQINCGGLTFTNFQVSPAAGNPSPEIDLVSALYDPLNGMVNLAFNPNLSAPPSAGAQDIHFFFDVIGRLDQIDLGVGGVNATLVERVCSTPVPRMGQANEGLCPQGSVLANLVAFSAPPGPNTAVSARFGPVSSAYIFKDIGVSPSSPNATGGALTTFSQSFHTAVPEPATFLLFGLGLVSIRLWGRRREARVAQGTTRPTRNR